MNLELAFIVAGLVLLFLGGESLVRGSVAVAERLGVSKLIIGLVIVGFGTSTPELLVSLKAAFAGSPDLALGNVVGSNVANVLLIIGIAALLRPIMDWDGPARREAVMMSIASVALVILVQQDAITRAAGAAMLAALSIYLFTAYILEKRRRKSTVYELQASEFEDTILDPLWLASLFVMGGGFMLLFGANFLLKGAVSIAQSLGVSEAVIGLSIVAVGTSLPELATAIIAAMRKQTDVVLGNVIGSNIFNILAILGATAAITPISVGERFRDLDAPLMATIMVALTVLLFMTKRLGRVIGAVFLIAYATYVYVLFMNGAGA